MLDDAEGRVPSHLGRGWGGATEISGSGTMGPGLRAGFDQLAGILARQLWSLLIPALLIPVLGMIAIARMPVLYTATGTIIYDPAGYTPDVLQSILKSDPTTDTVVASQGAILGSLSIAHRVAVGLDLGVQPGFMPQGDVPVAERPLAVDAAVMKATTVSSVDDSRVFAVSFAARDPGLSAAAVNMMMDLYLADQLDLKTTALRAATQWMENRAVELRAKALAQDAAIAAYRQANGLIDGVQARIGTEEISTLSDDLMRAENDVAGARARQDVAVGGGLSQNVVAMRLAEVQSQANLDAALAHLGPNHPEVRALREQVDTLRAAAGAETAAARSGVVSDAQAAEARLATLRDNLFTLQQEGAREAAAEVPLQAMEQDADATRRLLQALLIRMDQTAQQEAIETPDARILSRAETPATSSSPRRGLLLAASGLAGIVFGGGLAWLREVGGTTFRTEAEILAGLGLPCMGAIPRMARRGGLVHRRLVAGGSSAARQLRLLRGRLRLNAADPRILAVTSTRPGEGKSSLALALARSAALAGERVLLVDCDVMRPNLSRILALGDRPGLAELLAEREDGRNFLHQDALSGACFPARRADAREVADWRARDQGDDGGVAP